MKGTIAASQRPSSAIARENQKRRMIALAERWMLRSFAQTAGKNDSNVEAKVGISDAEVYLKDS